MSLEERVAALIAALEENTKVLEENTKCLQLITNVGAARAKAKDEAKDEAKDTEDKPARTRRASTKTEKVDEKPAKSKAPTVEEMKSVAEDFLSVKDDDEYDARRQLVIAITEAVDDGETFSKIKSADNKRLATAALEKIKTLLEDGETVRPRDVQGIIDDIRDGDDDGRTEEAEERPARRRAADV